MGKAHYDTGTHMLVTGRDEISAFYTIYFHSFARGYRCNFSDFLVARFTFNKWGRSVGIRCHMSMIEMPAQGTGRMVQYKTE